MGAMAKIFVENLRYMKKKYYRPFLKGACMKMIIWYQKYISLHTCLYYPTCSQYTLESINNYGTILGVLMGAYRILRCNPFSRGGYDPVPEKKWKIKWLI